MGLIKTLVIENNKKQQLLDRDIHTSNVQRQGSYDKPLGYHPKVLKVIQWEVQSQQYPRMVPFVPREQPGEELY